VADLPQIRAGTSRHRDSGGYVLEERVSADAGMSTFETLIAKSTGPESLDLGGIGLT